MEKIELLDVAQVARMLAVKPGWVYRRALYGEIPHLKIGGRVRFDPRELEAWIDLHRHRGTEPR